MENIFLTGVRNVDEIILNKLEDRDLVNACQVNIKANEICNDQTFWMNRTLQRYPFIPLNIIETYRGDKDWSDYYISDLRTVQPENAEGSLVKASREGRLDLVMVALHKSSRDGGNDIAIDTALEYGHGDIVKYLVDNDPWVQHWNRSQKKILEKVQHIIPESTIQFYDYIRKGHAGAYLFVSLPDYKIKIDVEDVLTMEQYLNKRVVVLRVKHRNKHIENKGFVETMEQAGEIVEKLKQNRFEEAMKSLFRLKSGRQFKQVRSPAELNEIVQRSKTQSTNGIIGLFVLNLIHRFDLSNDPKGTNFKFKVLWFS